VNTVPTDAPKPRRFHLDKRAHSLAEQGPGAPDDLLNTQQLAAWLGVSVLWLEIGRNKNYGPRFMKLGPRMVRYRRDDVLCWLKSRVHDSTPKYKRTAQAATLGRSHHA
jgi:predicted DNA-binding transcriptional regulator AlpA